MASAWGKSWGAAWGDSWGSVSAEVPSPRGGDILERSVRREDPRIREDEEILTVIMAFMEMIE